MLAVTVTQASAAGRRARNEDYAGHVTPTSAELARKGVVAAVADGVSGHAGAREAAEYAVRGLLADYYATPEAWTPGEALERVLESINAWVLQEAQRRRELTGMATTLTALVLRGRRYTIAHVGDSRAYLVRDGALTQVTADHCWDRPGLGHVLARGLGLDTRIAVDVHEGELAPNDRFVLVTDGVWSALGPKQLATHADAQALIDAARTRGAGDDATAIVVDVRTLGDDALQDLALDHGDRPALRRLQRGDAVDGLHVDALLHESVATRVYRVVDRAAQRTLVLKTLGEDRANDPAARARFAHEEWLARRVVARWFAQVVQRAQPRSAIYYLQTWHAGATLRALLERGEEPTVPEILRIAIALARALGALHRRAILHRDVKPDNVHVGDDGEVRLLDFGVAQTFAEAAADPRRRAGTPSFLAPELIDGGAPSLATDLYALGVTLYVALTRHYPYGEIEPFQRPRFGTPTPPTRWRPQIPVWLENVLLKAVARDPAQRFETAEELLLALERGAARPLPAPRPEPLAARNPLRTWQLIALVSLLANLLLVYALLVRVSSP